MFIKHFSKHYNVNVYLKMFSNTKDKAILNRELPYYQLHPIFDLTTSK